jgi:hypothetical protein
MARMTAALETGVLAVPQQVKLHFALGKALDDCGDYAEAMRHFDAGNRLRGGFVKLDRSRLQSLVDCLIARCTPDYFARHASIGADDETPLLIVGMPRSGTTLVEQIVSNHSRISAGGELLFWGTHGPVWYEQGAEETTAVRMPQLAADYRALFHRLAPGAARVTDKMPFNFLWAGLIHLAFPRATIIHCRRAAIDTGLSIHQTLFHPGLAFPTGGSKLVAYFRSYRRLTDHWRRVLPADRFIEIEYEDLTREPEPVIRRIISGAGLPWEDACLRPERNPRAVKTPSKWQTRQPIYRDSVERWRRYEPWLGPLRALLDGA